MVSDLKTSAHEECKIAAAKKVFYKKILFICSLRSNVFLPPLPEVRCPNFLDTYTNIYIKILMHVSLFLFNTSLTFD